MPNLLSLHNHRQRPQQPLPAHRRFKVSGLHPIDASERHVHATFTRNSTTHLPPTQKRALDMVSMFRSSPTREDSSRSQQSQLFTLRLLGVAAAAMAAGTLLALWLVSPPDEEAPTAFERTFEPTAEGPGFEPFDDPPPPKVAARTPRRTRTRLGRADLERGFGRLDGAFDACARTHGALDGTVLTVDIDVAPGGTISTAHVQRPHAATPLGRCIADVLESKGSFRRTSQGASGVRRRIRLQRTKL